jgi:transcriptional regulator with XRE-family HTH domain
MSIGEKVRKIRKEKGLSIMDLKEKTGLSKSTISDLENDKSSPTIDTLQKIADALDVDVRDFFEDNTEKQSANITNIDDLLEEFPEGVYVLRRASKKLSPEAKKQMIRIMKAFLEEDGE